MTVTVVKPVKMAEKEQLIVIDVERGEDPTPITTPEVKVTSTAILPEPCGGNGRCASWWYFSLAAVMFGVMGVGIWMRPAKLECNKPFGPLKVWIYPMGGGFTFEDPCPDGNGSTIQESDGGTSLFDTNCSTFSTSMNRSMEEALRDLRKQLYDCRVGVNPLSYSDPERQIIFKIRSEGFKLLDPQCVEYQVNKSNSSVMQCKNAEAAFLETLQNLTQIEGGVASYECNYTLQLALDDAAAVWTNESCKTVLGNGEAYHEITQVTYKGEIRTLDDENFRSVRKDMETWCKCIKRVGSYDDVNEYYYQECLAELTRTASRALILSKGYQQACSNPGEAMLGVISWKNTHNEIKLY